MYAILFYGNQRNGIISQTKTSIDREPSILKYEAKQAVQYLKVNKAIDSDVVEMVKSTGRECILSYFIRPVLKKK